MLSVEIEALVERMVEERLGRVVSALREQVEDIDANIERVVRAVMRAILDTRIQ